MKSGDVSITNNDSNENPYNFTITGKVNRMPVVTANAGSVRVNQSVAAATLFSVTDADGDAITQYQFYDYGGGGYYTLNGVVQASHVHFVVSAANLAALNFVGGVSTKAKSVLVKALMRRLQFFSKKMDCGSCGTSQANLGCEAWRSLREASRSELRLSMPGVRRLLRKNRRSAILSNKLPGT